MQRLIAKGIICKKPFRKKSSSHFLPNNFYQSEHKSDTPSSKLFKSTGFRQKCRLFGKRDGHPANAMESDKRLSNPAFTD